jgi:hypothetical protein
MNGLGLGHANKCEDTIAALLIVSLKFPNRDHPFNLNLTAATSSRFLFAGEVSEMIQKDLSRTTKCSVIVQKR